MKRLFQMLCFAFLMNTNGVFGQWFQKISFKTGPTYSGQNKTPRFLADGGNIWGGSFTIEPTFLSFGKGKRFDLNADISYIQKGSYNYSPIYSYFSNGQPGGTGSVTYPVTINYYSFSLCLKQNHWKHFFIRAGPRIDLFQSFFTEHSFSADPRTNKDFDPITYGITYGFGVTSGAKKVRFICEFLGQNDFTNSSFNKASGQTFRNFCYLLNFGILIGLK